MLQVLRNVDEAGAHSPKLRLIGVGGAGCNAINAMIEAKLEGVEFIAANTDEDALATNQAEIKIALGPMLTKGLGAGANPKIGESAALEVEHKIAAVLEGAEIVFIAAGMGGGTGTGAAPVIAKIARRRGVLTIGLITKPFLFEGKQRREQAEAGIGCGSVA